MYCKHRFGILVGKAAGIVSDNTDQVDLVSSWLSGSDVEAAMQQVFGKKLLCRSMEVASEVSERFEVDAVTLEGDEVNRRGGLHGGYIDVRRSRIKAMDSVRQAKEDLGNISAEVSEKPKEQN